MQCLSLCLTFVVLCHAAQNTTNCGRRFGRRARIVGGELATDGEFPWVVSLLFNGFHYCGGTVLSNRWVLTAAHCVTNYGPGNFAVRVGVTSRDGTSVIVRVTKVFLHPRFSMPYLYDHDIALVLLTTRLVFNRYVQPVCLPQCSSGRNTVPNNLTDVLATAVGWGYVMDSSIPQQYSAGLRKVQVPIVDYQRCEQWYAEAGKVGLKLTSSQICAGYKSGGKDACLGDSGGPLTVTDGKGRAAIVGVISAGIGCARPLLPGIYTRVSAYSDWIKTSMDQVAG